MADKEFYLGRIYDASTGKVTPQALFYDPADLTTHGVVTGMTGSGKTGLCIALLEEAALQGIPAIIIDPKGDLTNLLLHFPDLAPQDFQPWIDPDIARRAGKSLEQAGTEASLSWRNGLEEWGIASDRILALKNAAEFAIYTPGSDAGIPVSVLSSLAAPALDWEENREVLRERITSTVTALLGLVGITDVDPLRSREHILLSNLFEAAWSQGKDIDLTELILQTQKPPFERLGAFPVDAFFPAKERMELAMQLNNILAAPAFEAWREGQSLDIQALLFAEDGRPRHSVFYLAHLSDAERMFFVTLLLAAVETWMRGQPGSTALRALLYMDEIFGYLPPTLNPPSKGPLLRMLKQARAFGLGLLLATQNPVDLDYKALSNAGTWFIGKLQTEQDKNRLLDGLESAAGGVPRAGFDKLISSLGKRVFIMQNVHEKAPVLFQTRWAMNFLPGPLTRTQIPALNELAGAKQTLPARPAKPVARAEAPATDWQPLPGPTMVPDMEEVQPVRTVKPAVSLDEGSATRPAVPAGVAEYFLPENYSLTEAFRAAGKTMPADAMIESILYRPVLLASARVRFFDRKYGVDSEMAQISLVTAPQRRGALRWEDFPYEGPPLDRLEGQPAASARFAMIDSPLSDARQMTALQRDFADGVYRSMSVKARANEALKVYAGPDVSQADFMKACADTAREARDAEILKKTAVLDRQIKTLQDKLAREERELRQDEADYNQRKMEELGTHAENVLGLFTGSRSTRKLSSSLTKRRLTEHAKEDVQESVESIDLYRKQLADLQQSRQTVANEVTSAWGDMVNKVSEVSIKPKKTDVYVDRFGIAWMPYYVVRAGSGSLEIPAFGPD